MQNESVSERWHQPKSAVRYSCEPDFYRPKAANAHRPISCMDGVAVIGSNPRSHQPADGLIHHRPIINGQKLLADTLGNRVKTCAGAAGEDEAFHCIVFLFLL